MLVDLGAAVLSAVLLGTPLPGLLQTPRLADIALTIDEDRRVRLLDEGLAGQAAERLASSFDAGVGVHDVSGLRLVGTEAPGSSAAGGLFGAVRLRIVEIGDAVRVTVETCVRRDRSDAFVTIEALNLTFTDQDGRWVVAEPPSHLAT